MSLAPVAPPSTPASRPARPWILAAETLAYDGGGERMIERTAHAARTDRPVRVLPIFEGGHVGRTAEALCRAGIPVDEVTPFPHRIARLGDLVPRERWRAWTRFLEECDAGAVVCYSLRGALRLAEPCRRANVPLVLSLHQTGPFFSGPLAGAKSWAARHLLLRSVQRWLVLSEAARQELLDWGMPEDRVRIVPNGLDLEHWHVDRVSEADVAEIRSRAGAGSGDLLIGVLARLHPLKNHALVIEALARSPSTTWRLVIAGGEAAEAPGHLEELKGTARRLGVADRVTFLGHVSDARPFLAASDVIVQPSTREASPLSILEALAMERPVVATAVGGVPELLGHGRNGWSIPRGSVEAMVGALEAIERDPAEAARRARRGREHVVAHHDWEQTAAALVREIAAVARG